MIEIPQPILNELQLRFLGKKISVEIKDSKPVIGVCEFIGHNPFFPHWGLQVVIDRYPLTNVDVKSISLVE
jgi:hypothetical protein